MSNHNQKSAVSITALDGYENFEKVLLAIRTGLDSLGGMQKFVKPGQKVLLKPNLVAPSKPGKVISPDASILRAVMRLVKECGGIIKVGDGPGVGDTKLVLESCGMLKVIEEEGGEVAVFQEKTIFEKLDNRVGRRIGLTSHLTDCDVLITLPKLKTHVQMGFTGAIKNQYGLIPGSAKAQYHFRFQNRDRFSDLIVDINRIAKPALAIMDAVIGMEGPGPSGGSPRKIGAIICSADLAAVDVVCCKIIGIDPEKYPINQAVRRADFGATRLSEIDIIGENWEKFYVSDYKLVPIPKNIMKILPLPNWILKWIRRQIAPRPVILVEKCIQCGRCMRGCPIDPPAIQPFAKGGPKLNDKTCIRCYCCHEFCPAKAIELRPSLLDKIFHLRKVTDYSARVIGKVKALFEKCRKK
ncbi:MAG: DUF362 domain-containing protein [Lentisphaeria bacterium]